MSAYKRVAFVGIILFLFGVVITIYGFSFLLQENELSENGVIVKGKVVDINEKDFYRAPFIEFTTLEGEKIIFLSPLDVNVDFFDYKIGDEVEVIYNKNNPKHAQINAFWERNTAQMYLGFVGIFLIFFGLLFRRRMLRKARRAASV